MLTVSRAGLPGLGAAARSRPRYVAVAVRRHEGDRAPGGELPLAAQPALGAPRPTPQRLQPGDVPGVGDQPPPARPRGERDLLAAAQVAHRQAGPGEHLDVVGGVGRELHRDLAGGRARRGAGVVERDDLLGGQPLPGRPLGAVLRHPVAVPVAVADQRDRRPDRHPPGVGPAPRPRPAWRPRSRPPRAPPRRRRRARGTAGCGSWAGLRGRVSRHVTTGAGVVFLVMAPRCSTAPTTERCELRICNSPAPRLTRSTVRRWSSSELPSRW